MTEADERLLGLLGSLDEMLNYVSNKTASRETVSHISTTLLWINTYLDRAVVIAFIERHSNRLANGLAIIELLRSPHFNAH